MRFNLSKVAPDGFLHHQGFNEVIDSVGWALSSLGHEASTSLNWLSEKKEHNIIFGCEQLADWQKLPPNTTVFNLEQLPYHPYAQKVMQLCKDIEVWDYSLKNIEIWKQAGHRRVRHVPIGYTPNLTRIQRASQQDIDVLFVGWMTPRRIELIEQLQRAGLNVFSGAACYGGGRDQLISRSKIVLNVHHDGRDMFEVVRCSYYLANQCCVVSEIFSDSAEYEDLNFIRSEYRSLVDTCKSFASAEENQRRALAGYGYESFRKRDFAASIATALSAENRETLKTIAPQVIDTRTQFAKQQAERKQSYFDQARKIQRPTAEPHTRAVERFAKACVEGDMKDFAEWLRKNAKGNIVEIGVRDGASTSAFLCGLQDKGEGHLYSIDVADFSSLFAGHPRWSFLRANSTNFDAVTKFIPFEVDILLIDGDHSYAGVKYDFEYTRQLRAGGMVLFHDTRPEAKPEGCHDCSWPSDDVQRFYAEQCVESAKHGWTHFEVPGRYGLGVLVKPEAKPDSDESWEASKALLQPQA